MRVILNNKEVIIPSALSEFTLGQRIAFHDKYGRELDMMIESILKMPEDDPMRELETTHFLYEKMFRTFAFFANVHVDAVREYKSLDDVAIIYQTALAALFNEEATSEFKREFEWEGETWAIESPSIGNSSKMTFGEFIDSKQLVKDMNEMGKGKWESMLPICAIYLRKKGEQYDPSFMYEGSDRLELMKKLPMDIALQVGFFLTSTMNIYTNTLSYSGSQEQKEEAVI